jgi:repressor LexA
VGERSSKRQRELLSFVDGFIKTNGFGPSYREIMRALEYKSVSTVAVHIDNLISKGYLIKRNHSARSLEVVTTEIKADTYPAALSDSEHRKWLADLILTRISSQAGATSSEISDYKTLVKSLEILGFLPEHKRADSKLQDLITGDE